MNVPQPIRQVRTLPKIGLAVLFLLAMVFAGAFVYVKRPPPEEGAKRIIELQLLTAEKLSATHLMQCIGDSSPEMLHGGGGEELFLDEAVRANGSFLGEQLLFSYELEAADPRQTKESLAARLEACNRMPFRQVWRLQNGPIRTVLFLGANESGQKVFYARFGEKRILAGGVSEKLAASIKSCADISKFINSVVNLERTEAGIKAESVR